jgi:long-subunit fatty acid transport protein
MKKITLAGAALLASTAAASAGGVERSAQSVAILFEEGTYAEFSFAWVDPEVSGVSQIPFGPSPAGSMSGDIAPSYTTLSFGYRRDLTDQLSMALIYDNHIGADVNYSPSAYLYGAGAGSTAEIEGNSLTALLRYEFPSNFSVYGGARISRVSGDVALFNGYTMTSDTSTAYGWVLGAAYERPDIALRVALTYNSAIDHDFDVLEAGLFNTTFSTTIPESVNLEFQSGVAENTLVFGSIRWVNWPQFDITPDVFSDGVPNGLYGPNSLVDYDNPSTTYTIGVGRRFNENWSGSLSYVYEESQGGFSGNLGPTDGRQGVGLGLRYETGSGMSISGGVQYSWIGSAVTEAPAPAPAGTTYGAFSGSTSIAAGLRVGFNF